MEVLAVGENGRWQLTDLQRFLVVLTVVLAFFVAAMALGSASVPLFLVAAGLLIAAGLAVFLLGLRHNGRKPLQGTGYVISVQKPPADNIQGRCDMRMRVNLQGRPAVDLKVRSPAVPVTRWPVVGQTLPIEAPPNNPRQIRVRWDLVELGYSRAPDATPPRQSTGSPLDAIPVHSPTPAVRVYTQYAESTARAEGSADGGTLQMEPPTITYDPRDFEPDPAIDDDYTPPRPRRPSATPLVIPAHDIDGEFDEYGDPVDDLDGPTVHTGLTKNPGSEEPTQRVADAPPPWMPSVFAPKELTAAPEPIPAPRDEILAPSWEIDPPTERVPDPEPNPRGGGVGRDEPDPNRDAEEPPIRFFNSERNEQDMPAMGGMLIVSDLDRSLRFYSDLLGFTIVYASSGNAVVEYGGARVLLQHMADFSEIDRRVVHLHIEVPDLELAFADLVAKGVQFSHRPRVASRGDKIELWKATFRDPDGHGIALTEWREREDD